MAIISSFLCWNNTRTGSAVCAYYSLVISVVCVSFYVFRYLAMGEIETAVEYKGIVYPGFVLYTVMIGVSLIMLPGVYMDRKLLLLPWVYTVVVVVLYETGAIALLTTVHLSRDKILKGWEISALCFYTFRLLANCYCFACVVSQYQELTEGRGTYDFLYKPERHTRHLPPQPVDDVYFPPYGAQLPPYSEVNPHKSFNPPDYDKLSMLYDNPAFCTESSATLPACLRFQEEADVTAAFRGLRLEINHHQPHTSTTSTLTPSNTNTAIATNTDTSNTTTNIVAATATSSSTDNDLVTVMAMSQDEEVGEVAGEVREEAGRGREDLPSSPISLLSSSSCPGRSRLGRSCDSDGVGVDWGGGGGGGGPYCFSTSAEIHHQCPSLSATHLSPERGAGDVYRATYVTWI